MNYWMLSIRFVSNEESYDRHALFTSVYYTFVSDPWFFVLVCQLR